MSPPRWPVPRPSSSSLAIYFTCARIFSLSTMGSGASAAGDFFFACSAANSAFTKILAAADSTDKENAVHFFMETPRRETKLLFDAILQQILQLAHEFLHVLEVHVHRCK